MKVDIYRDGLQIFTIKPNEDSAQAMSIMGENYIGLNFSDSQYINFKIGDRAKFFDVWYTLNQPPTVTKQSSVQYDYQMRLEAPLHALDHVQYLFLGDDNSLKEGDFTLTGTVKTFLDLLLMNTERLKPIYNFTIGEFVANEYKTISFSPASCLDALGKIAEAFGTEYLVDNETIHVVKRQRDTGYEFRNGKRKGLYEIVRNNSDSSSVITRIYPFGGTQNLPTNYRNFSKRLKIPAQPYPLVSFVNFSLAPDGIAGAWKVSFWWTAPTTTGVTGVIILKRKKDSGDVFGSPETGSEIATELSPRIIEFPANDGAYEFIFQTQLPGGAQITIPIVIDPYGEHIGYASQNFGPYLQNTGADTLYLEKNVSKYGVRELVYINDSIYPNRTGKVTSVNAADVYEFSDDSMNFDVNDYLLPGMTAKVTFNTGQLSGYTFDIGSYNNGTKTFRILTNKDERAIDIPSGFFKPSIGDEYVIVDIYMPPSYLIAAENKLKDAAKTYLDAISEPVFSFGLQFDPTYLRDKGYALKLGDLIWIIDNDLQVQKKMRVININRSIVNEWTVQADISDIVAQGTISALQSGQARLSDSVNSLNQSMTNNSILNNRVIGDLRFVGQASIIFEDLQAGSGGITPIGIDANGKVCKI